MDLSEGDYITIGDFNKLSPKIKELLCQCEPVEWTHERIAEIKRYLQEERGRERTREGVKLISE